MAPSQSSNAPAARLTPEKVVEDIRDLPAAPKVLPKLKRLLSDGNSSLYEIVGLIRVEPGIAARVLQVSNSAYYCKGGARCASVEEAVGRVGYDQVYEMVMYAVASQVLVRPLATYRIEADDFWRISVACGISAEVLAEMVGQPRDTAYTLGLLANIGMVAIDSWALRNNPSLLMTPKPYPKEYTQSERALVSFTHADVGSVLLARWDFPQEVCESVKWQYSPLSAGTHSKLACLLYASKWLRAAVCPEVHGAPEPPADAFLQPLRLNVERLTKIAEDVKARMEDLKTLLEADEEEEKPAKA